VQHGPDQKNLLMMMMIITVEIRKGPIDLVVNATSNFFINLLVKNMRNILQKEDVEAKMLHVSHLNLLNHNLNYQDLVVVRPAVVVEVLYQDPNPEVNHLIY
jgi:hypothetical protein